MKVDHVNGDGLNNLPHNVRSATQSQNCHNAGIRSNNTSGFKGVTFYKSRNNWMAQIWVNGKRKGLGYFITPEEAHEAYCQAAKDLHGEFARTE